MPLINQEEARLAGVNRSDIASAINRATEGTSLGVMRDQYNLIPIKLRSSNASLEHFENIPVRSILGINSVPLGQVIDGFEVKGEESMIWRYNRQLAITAQADVTGDTASNVRKRNSHHN